MMCVLVIYNSARVDTVLKPCNSKWTNTFVQRLQGPVLSRLYPAYTMWIPTHPTRCSTLHSWVEIKNESTASGVLVACICATSGNEQVHDMLGHAFRKIDRFTCIWNILLICFCLHYSIAYMRLTSDTVKINTKISTRWTYAIITRHKQVFRIEFLKCLGISWYIEIYIHV
jgi:hypothetical protein